MKDKNFVITVTTLVTLIVIASIILFVQSNNSKEKLETESKQQEVKEVIKEDNNVDVKEETETKETVKTETKTKETKSNSSTKNKTNNTSTKTETQKEVNETEVKDEDNKEDVVIENKYENDKEEITETIEVINEEVYSSNDKKVCEEIENIFKDLKESFNSDTSKEALKKAKGVFITFVDFVFFDGEIKGVKFDELTSAGKEKALSLINKVDEYIEGYYPGYKEDISSSTKESFTMAASLIKKGANKISDFSKEKLGEENYNKIIDAKDDLVTYTKSAASIVKNVSVNLYDKAKNKLKDWYLNFKNS